MTDTIRHQAERARASAQQAYETSEYPRYGRAAHLGHAQALDDLADTLAAIGEDAPAPTGNRREDRRARRVYWLRRRAAEKRVESAQLAARSHDMGSTRPMGQPLQGSPARRRTQLRAIERERRVDERAHRAYRDAEELERRARAAERNRAVYADDPDALEKLQRKLASLERKRDAMKATRGKAALPLLNYQARWGIDVQNPYQPGETTHYTQVEMTRAEYQKHLPESKGTLVAAVGSHRVRMVFGLRITAAVFLTDSKVHKRPADQTPTGEVEGVGTYALANIGARIRTVKARIAELDARAQREERPARRIGDVEVIDNLEFHKVELYFPGKPAAETRTMLKRYGFRWIRTAGCWSRSINGDTEWRLTALAEHLGSPLELVECPTQ